MKKRSVFFPFVFFLFFFDSCPSGKTGTPSGGGFDPELVVATVDGTDITRRQVEEQMLTANRIYQALEESLPAEIIREKKLEARKQILDSLIEKQIVLNRAGSIEKNLDGEDMARIDAAYEAGVNRLADYVRKSYPYLGRGETLEEVETLLKTSRLDLEDLRGSARNLVLQELLYESVVAEAGEPSPAEIEGYYGRLLAEQKEKFEENISRYEQALLAGDPVAFRPAGCRVIRELNIRFDADVIGLIRQLESFDSRAEAEKMRQDQFLRQEEKVKRILEKSRTTPFEQLAAGEPGADISPARNYISPGSSRFSAEYRDAALGIAHTGSLSEPFRTEYGTTILYWEENTGPRGEVPLEEIYDTIREAARREKHDRVREEARALWRREAAIRLYPENLE
ncbi:MAG: SurA N-terminal domain-containing protein [Treponema sp.]|jgi:parvulin-like peptidyl-prolyl isomerase|nr:SurA N-terminal domain-containing protein [Treponema sp.]